MPYITSNHERPRHHRHRHHLRPRNHPALDLRRRLRRRLSRHQAAAASHLRPHPKPHAPPPHPSMVHCQRNRSHPHPQISTPKIPTSQTNPRHQSWRRRRRSFAATQRSQEIGRARGGGRRQEPPLHGGGRRPERNGFLRGPMLQGRQGLGAGGSPENPQADVDSHV